jgi:TRAP-type transport system periplasmic protein
MSQATRTKLLTSLAAIVALTLAACGGSNGDDGNGDGNGDSEPEEVFTLQLATPTPATHHWSRNAFGPWKEFVESETNGRVEVEIYEGGTLGSFDSVLTDLQGGVYDVGIVIPSYFLDSAFFPLSMATLAFAYPEPETGGKIANAFMSQHGDQLQVDGVRNMGWVVSDNYIYFSKDPVTSADDFRGATIRAQGQADARLIEAWGGIPATVSIQETYEALDKRVLDMTPYSPVGVMGIKLYEVAPHVVDAKVLGTNVVPAMSQRFYDDLPSDLQALFDETLNPRLVELMQQSYIDEQDAAMSALPDLVEEYGGSLSSLPSVEFAKLQDAASGQWEAWIADADERGYDGKGLVRSYLELMVAEGVTPPVDY